MLAVEELVAAMENGGKVSSTAQDGRAALELGLAVFESGRRDGERVWLPLADRKVCVVSR